MAILEAFADIIGTGTENRQPSAGVFEKIMHIVKEGTTDPISLYDGSTAFLIYEGLIVTERDGQNTGQAGANPYQMAIIIGNTHYLRKEGTTDAVAIGGVQVDT